MEKIVFEKREITGKKSKNLLNEGFVPAVVYNTKGESTNIKIEEGEAKRILREATSTTILDSELDGKAIKVVVKDIDINPLTDQIRHISLFEIDENKEMVFTIPFNIVGIAPAVKNNLGVLVEVLNSIDVRCKLSALVPSLDVDITKLEHPGQSISVNEVEIPKEMSLVNDELSHAAIVTVTEIQKEEIIETPEEEDEEGVAEGEDEGVEGETQDQTTEESEA